MLFGEEGSQMDWLVRLITGGRPHSRIIPRQMMREHELVFSNQWAAVNEESRSTELAIAYHRSACERVRIKYNLPPRAEVAVWFETLPNVAWITGFDLEKLKAWELDRLDSMPDHTRRYYGIEGRSDTLF